MNPAPPVIRILFPIVIEPCTTVSPQYATSPIQQLGSSPLLFTGPCLESRLQPASLCKPPCRSKTSQASLVISFSPQRGEGRVRGEKVRSALSPFPFPPFCGPLLIEFSFSCFDFQTPEVIDNPESCGASSGYRSLQCIRKARAALGLWTTAGFRPDVHA